MSPEQHELDVLLEEIMERGIVANENNEVANEKKEKDKATRKEVWKQALERMGQTENRKSQDEAEEAVKEKRKRRSGNDAVEFLKEMVLREKEFDLKRKEQQEKARQLGLMF